MTDSHLPGCPGCAQCPPTAQRATVEPVDVRLIGAPAAVDLAVARLGQSFTAGPRRASGHNPQQDLQRGTLLVYLPDEPPPTAAAARTAGVTVEVHPSGLPAAPVRLQVGNMGPEPLSAPEQVRTLRAAADQLAGGPDAELGSALAAIDHTLRNGADMSGANLALDMLCDRLGVEREGLRYHPGWVRTLMRDGAGGG